MPNHLVRYLALPLFPTCLFAQGTLPLSGSWRLGSITAETFGGTCAPAAPVHAVLEDGIVSFQPGGTASFSISTSEVCPGGACTQSMGTGSTNYQVTADGVVLLDDNPGAPGSDWGLGFLRSDASVLMLGRWNDQEDEPYLGIAVALSSGRSAASLSGTYGFARFVLRNDAISQTMRGDYGTITWNGAGSFAEASDRHEVTWNGLPTALTGFSGNGTYGVAPDGTVTIGGGGQGAVSADGEFVFWVRQSCPEVEMVVAVRLPLPGGTTFVDGDWRMCTAEVDVSTSTLDSDWGTITLIPAGASGGALTPTLFHASTFVSTFGTMTNVPNVVFDTYSQGSGGRIDLFSQAAQRNPVPTWVSRDGSVFVGAPSLPTALATSGGCGLSVGLARCALPAQVGAGTPGSAGITPLLLPIGGFPYPGNTNFGLVVAAGLGGAPGLLLFSGATLPAGIPVLGFELWLDPGLLAGSALVVLSGPANVPGIGAAGLQFALPSMPSLSGTSFATQAIVLDAGVPAGLSASRALAIRIGR